MTHPRDRAARASSAPSSVALLGERHEVVGLDLPECDLTDRDQVLGAVTSAASRTLLLHGAAFTAVDVCESDPETAYRVNSLATRFVADGARRVGAHVVYVSTDYVFDGTKAGPYVEWDATNPQSVYGASKLGGEHEIDPSWTIARTSWVCSAHGNNMVKTVLKLAAERDTLSFVDDQIGHPTFAVRPGGDGRAAGHRPRAGCVPCHQPGRGELVRVRAGDLLGRGPRPGSGAADLHRAVPGLRPADAPPMAPRPANSVLDNFALRHSGFGELRDFREPLAETVQRLPG